MSKQEKGELNETGTKREFELDTSASDDVTAVETASRDTQAKKVAPGEASPLHHLAEMRRNPDAIRELFLTGKYPYKTKMSTREYEAKKMELQVELLKVQRWAKETGQKIVILFEGRDAAGKGGAIKRITQPLNPRRARVVALSKPTEREQSQWYFQRYIEHLPTAGEMVLFDRSWYNRAGVETVIGFCSEAQHQDFLAAVPTFEKLLVEV